MKKQLFGIGLGFVVLASLPMLLVLQGCESSDDDDVPPVSGLDAASDGSGKSDGTIVNPDGAVGDDGSTNDAASDGSSASDGAANDAATDGGDATSDAASDASDAASDATSDAGDAGQPTDAAPAPPRDGGPDFDAFAPNDASINPTGFMGDADGGSCPEPFEDTAPEIAQYDTTSSIPVPTGDPMGLGPAGLLDGVYYRVFDTNYGQTDSSATGECFRETIIIGSHATLIASHFFQFQCGADEATTGQEYEERGTFVPTVGAGSARGPGLVLSFTCDVDIDRDNGGVVQSSPGAGDTTFYSVYAGPDGTYAIDIYLDADSVAPYGDRIQTFWRAPN